MRTLRKRLAVIFAALLLTVAVVTPTADATGPIYECQVNYASCMDRAQTNYNNCMATPAGTWLVCGAWYQWDTSGCYACGTQPSTARLMGG